MHSQRQQKKAKLFSVRELQDRLVNTMGFVGLDEPESFDACSVCDMPGELALCESCPRAYHTNCLIGNAFEADDWVCSRCTHEASGEQGQERDAGCYFDGPMPCDGEGPWGPLRSLATAVLDHDTAVYFDEPVTAEVLRDLEVR
jgi:hypothetical protein